jgi:hypothetical protein
MILSASGTHLTGLYVNRAPDEDHDIVGEITSFGKGRAAKILLRHRQSRLLAVARPTEMNMKSLEKLSAACQTHHEHVAAIYSLYISPLQRTLLCEHLEFSLRELTLESETHIASAMEQVGAFLHHLVRRPR